MMATDPALPGCWQTIGIFGNRDCVELREQVHCRNCPVYRGASRMVLARPLPLDYREELGRRLAQAEVAAPAQTLRLFAFRVQTLWLVLPTACLEASLPLPSIARIPARSNRHFLGIANLQGEPGLCFTLEHWLRPEPAEPVGPARAAPVFPRLLVLGLAGGRWAVTATEVLGAIAVPDSALLAPPANLVKSARGLVRALLDWEGRRFHLLDPERLAAVMQEALR